MRALAQRLSTGKSLVGLTLAATLFFASGTLFGGAWRRLFLVCGIGTVSLLVLGLIVSYKQEVTLARASRRELELRQKRLAEQIGAAHGVLAFGDVAYSPLQGATDKDGGAAPRRFQTDSVYSPGTITATPVKSKPYAHTPGRVAADQDMEGDSSLQLARIYNASSGQRDRRVLWLGPVPNQISGNTGWVLEQVPPGAAMNRPHPAASYLVMNFSQTAFTPWEHVTSSPHTHTFRAVNGYVNQAKRNGAVVILIRETVPSHFTASLERVADVVLDSTLRPGAEETYESMPVFEFIRDAMEPGGESNE